MMNGTSSGFQDLREGWMKPHDVKVKEEGLYWKGKFRSISLGTNGFMFLQKHDKLIRHAGKRDRKMIKLLN